MAFTRPRTMPKALAILLAVLLACLVLVWWALTGNQDDRDPGPADPDAPASAPTGHDGVPSAEQAALLDSGDLERDASSALARTEVTRRAKVEGTGTIELLAWWGDRDEPAGGVRVEIVPQGPRDEGAQRARWLVTDADGTARAERVPAGPIAIQADRGMTKRFELAPDSLARIHLKLHLGVRVEGEVVDAAGQGMPGAAIWLAARPEWPGHGTIAGYADATGHFELRCVRPIAYVSALAAGRAASPSLPVLARIGSEQKLRLQVGGEQAVLQGLVLEPHGAPAADATLVAVQSIAQIARADRHGRFSFAHLDPARPLTLWAKSQHSAAARVPVPAASGQPFLTVPLPRGATVSGRLRDAQGRQGRLLHVRARPEQLSSPRADSPPYPTWLEPVAIADNLGDYELLHVAAGNVELRVVDSRSASLATQAVTLHDGQHLRWDVTLADKQDLTLVLSDERGAPLSDWRVAVTDSGRREHQREADTDAAGRATFSGCEHASYHAWVRPSKAPDLGFVATFASLAPGAPHHLTVPAATLPSCHVTMNLTGCDPAHGLMLRLARLDVEKKLHASVPLGDGPGTYRAGPLPAGRYSFQVDVQPYTISDLKDLFAGPAKNPIQQRRRPVRTVQATSKFGAGSNTHTLGEWTLAPGSTTDLGRFDLAETGTLRIEPADIARLGAERCRFCVYKLDVEGQTQVAERWFIKGQSQTLELRPGSYRVQVEDARFASAATETTVEPGKTATVQLALQTGIRCVVRRPELPTSSFWHEEWRDGEDRVVRSQTTFIHASSPRDVEVRLAPGSYRVSVRAGEGRKAEASWTIGREDEGRLLEIPRAASR